MATKKKTTEDSETTSNSKGKTSRKSATKKSKKSATKKSKKSTAKKSEKSATKKSKKSTAKKSKKSTAKQSKKSAAKGSKKSTSKKSRKSSKKKASLLDEVISVEGLGSLLCVAWSPSGELLAVAGNAGVITLLDAGTGEVVGTLRGYKEAVFALGFDGEGAQLVSAGGDKTVRVWDVEAREFLEDLSGILSMTPRMRTLRGQLMQGSSAGHTLPVLCVDWEPTTGVLATGGQDHLVKAWREGRALRTFDWHTDAVTAVRFRPDHPDMILSASRDATLRLWSVETGAMKARFDGHEDQIMAIAWVDEGTFVSGDLSGNLISWNVESESIRRRLISEGPPIRTLEMTPERKKIVAGFESGDLACYTLKKGREQARVEGHALALRASATDPADGSRMASVGIDGALRIWELG